MKKILFIWCLLLVSVSSLAEVSINGFGSIVAGKLTSGDGYIAEYTNLAIYEGSSVDFSQETRLGVQISADINEKTSATSQLVMRGANDYDVELSWLFLTYQIDNDKKVQLGRLRLPVYHFSEYMDVGYAYPWLRIPSDTYSLDVTNYNGVRYKQSFQVSDYVLELTGLFGREKDDDSQLISYLFPKQIDREFKNLYGGVVNFDMDTFVIRSSYVEGNLEETRHLQGWLATALGVEETYSSSLGTVDENGDPLVAFDTEYDISFFDVSMQWHFNDFHFFAEYNKFKPFYKSYFGSISYSFDEFEPYLLWSKFDLDEAWESHDTTSIGLRYNFMPAMALKFDISRFDDTGYNPFTREPNPVYKADNDGDGDITIVSMAIDFVF